MGRERRRVHLPGNGTSRYTGDSGPAVGATLYEPGSVAFNGSGDLFIADSLNNMVRKVLQP